MKSNFTSEALLCNSKIIIEGKNKELYVMKLPVLRDKIENHDYDTFLGFCAMDLKEFNKTSGLNLKHKLELLKLYREQGQKEIVKVLEKYFTRYMIGYHVKDEQMYWGNRIISKDIFQLFCDYMAVALGVKKIEELKLIITDDMDEITKRQIMLERKIAATKAKDPSGGGNVPLDLIMTGVCQEFGYSYADLYEMTPYSIYFMYSQLGKIMNYEINNIAAGNGLLKKNSKHKHWAS